MQGILSPADAKIAVEAGVDGIVVSNHGGRQLDYSPAAIEVISSIRDAVGQTVPLLMDGGIRWGTDVLKVGRLHLFECTYLPNPSLYDLCLCVPALFLGL